MIVPLEDAGPEHGGKAAGLGRALRAGRPVPRGIVVPAAVPLEGLAHALPAWVEDASSAVRSSASVEDGTRRSAAGMYDSVVGVRGRVAVAAAVAAVRESSVSERTLAYGLPVDAAMHVIVQRMVRADLGGVLLTDGERVVVEYVHGGPAGVVDGTVTPLRYAGAGPGPEVLRSVVRLGRELAREWGHDVDVEWALDDRRVWLLQVRPVTARLDGLDATGASAGVATGPVRVVEGPDDFAAVRPGEVLVCRTTDPAWTPLLQVVSAVVTEVGGILSHAAIVARERRVPAVVGLAGARELLTTGQWVRVDGSAGTVTPEIS